MCEPLFWFVLFNLVDSSLFALPVALHVGGFGGGSSGGFGSSSGGGGGGKLLSSTKMICIQKNLQIQRRYRLDCIFEALDFIYFVEFLKLTVNVHEVMIINKSKAFYNKSVVSRFWNFL